MYHLTLSSLLVLRSLLRPSRPCNMVTKRNNSRLSCCFVSLRSRIQKLLGLSTLYCVIASNTSSVGLTVFRRLLLPNNHHLVGLRDFPQYLRAIIADAGSVRATIPACSVIALAPSSELLSLFTLLTCALRVVAPRVRFRALLASVQVLPLQVKLSGLIC